MSPPATISNATPWLTCALVCVVRSESRTYIDTQLEAPLYHPQAARAVRHAGSDAATLENDATAMLTAHRDRDVAQER